MSYGHQQEAAAEALRQLLTTDSLAADTVPADAAGRARLVTVRDQLRLALMDRFTVIARGNVALDDRFKTERGMLSTLGTAACSTWHASSPTRRDRRAPSVLHRSTPSSNRPQTRASSWAPGGRRDQHRQPRPRRRHPTRHHRAGSWRLLRDAANTVEAFLILDARLDHTRLLDAYHCPQRPCKLRARRAVAATIAREATWVATDPSPDQASADTLEHSVQIVRDLDTLAAAQRRLAEFVRPQHPASPPFDPYRELTLTEAHPLLLAQARLSHQLSQAAPGELAEEFAQRRDLPLAVRRATAGLHDVVPRSPTPPRTADRRDHPQPQPDPRLEPTPPCRSTS